MKREALDAIKAKYYVAATIKVMQPALREDIVTYLREDFPTGIIEDALSRLADQGALMLDGDRYRLTKSGYRFITPGRGRFLSNIARMRFLVKASKEGRERHRGRRIVDHASQD